MQGQPLLSILLTTHTDADHLNSLLDKLSGADSDDYEMILINDHAAPSYIERVGKGLENHPVNNITRIDHNFQKGRAPSLNTALKAARGSFIWAPRKADRLNRQLLKAFIRKMKMEPVAFWILDRSLPSDIRGWITEAEEGTLPADEQLVFNREAIAAGRLYFKENLGRYAGVELAYRILERKPCQRTDSFFVVDRDKGPLPDPFIVQEFFFTMLRHHTDGSERESLIRRLAQLDMSLESRTGKSTDLDRVRQMAEQDARKALEMADTYLRINPGHTEAVKLKITLLEKLRRHVEAAELKHELMKSKSSRPEKPVSQPTLFSSITRENAETAPDPAESPDSVHNPGMDKDSRAGLPFRPGPEIPLRDRAEHGDEPEEPQSDETDDRQMDDTRKVDTDIQKDTGTGNPQGFAAEREQRDIAGYGDRSGMPQRNETEEPQNDGAGISQGGAADVPPKNRAGFKLSIIIPTTGHGLPYLEECLIHLDRQCDLATTELIVIDNASIDETFDYLSQLKERNFLNIKVITNSVNAGFGKSANQGIEAAAGEYLLIMHNDLILEDGAIEEMVGILDRNPRIGLTGPVADRCDVENQQAEHLAGINDDVIETDLLDSCCMLLRSSTEATFSETYGLAFFEDADLCNTVKQQGYRIAIAANATAAHRYRKTTDPMGLNLESELRLENADIYQVRWGNSRDEEFPAGGDIAEILKEVPLPLNPLNPPGYWLDQVDSLFSDEVKTEILKRSFSDENLFRMIRLLFIADKRDFLRQIESRVIDKPMPVDLLKDLTRYYFRRNIYSRCRLYLEKPEARGPYFDLYRLRISLEENEAGTVELLNKLMKEYPCHPDLYRIAARLHQMNGDEDEAKSFYALANQLKPEKTRDHEVFEIKY